MAKSCHRVVPGLAPALDGAGVQAHSDGSVVSIPAHRTRVTDFHPRWSRIVVEATVIVGSILLAFSIDAWWDGVQEERAERAAIARLLDEFEANRPELETVDRTHRAIYEGSLAVLDVGYGGVEPDAAFSDQVTLALTMEVRLDIETYALDSYLAVQDGRTERSPELRARLASYRSLVDQVWQQEDMTRSLVRGDIARALSERSEVLYLGAGGASTAMQERRDAYAPESWPAERLELVRDPVVRNLVTARTGREFVALVRTERLLAKYDSLMPLLRSGAGR